MPLVPRNVLRRVVAQYAEMGMQPVVSPDVEFCIVARNTVPDQPVQPPMGQTGHRVSSRQACPRSAVDEYGPVVDDTYDFAEAQGFEIGTIIQCGGAGGDHPQTRGSGYARGSGVSFQTSGERGLRRATKIKPPSWQSRWRTSRGRRCMFTIRCTTRKPDGTSSPLPMAAHVAAFGYFIGGLQSGNGVLICPSFSAAGFKARQ